MVTFTNKIGMDLKWTCFIKILIIYEPSTVKTAMNYGQILIQFVKHVKIKILSLQNQIK